MKVFVVFAAVACFAQSALSSWAPYHGAYAHGGYAHGAYAHGGYAHGGYHGPLATPVVTPSGYLADTPEVAAAKAAHLSEVAKASSHASAHGYAGAGYAGSYAGAYHGSYATPVVTPSGYLADTPEVAAAKAAHLSEVAKASSHAVVAPAHGYSGAYYGSHAAPVVLPSGFLADTPEVAAAKAAHLGLAAGAAHGAYVAPVSHWAGAYGAHYAGAYDDGSYKGEGAYSTHYDAARHYDDGSYKPHLYEHGHY